MYTLCQAWLRTLVQPHCIQMQPCRELAKHVGHMACLHLVHAFVPLCLLASLSSLDCEEQNTQSNSIECVPFASRKRLSSAGTMPKGALSANTGGIHASTNPSRNHLASSAPSTTPHSTITNAHWKKLCLNSCKLPSTNVPCTKGCTQGYADH